MVQIGLRYGYLLFTYQTFEINATSRTSKSRKRSGLSNIVNSKSLSLMVLEIFGVKGVIS